MTGGHTTLRNAVRDLMDWAGRSRDTFATDRELIERFNRDGSQEAFAELMARHGAMVRTVCRRHLRDAHAADDAFQATFLVLIRKARQVGWRECIGGWLFEVATRVARKAAGRSARDRALAGCSLEPAVPAPVSDLTAIQLALEEELRRLPDKFRAPLVLCHLEGLSQIEVAQLLRVTEGQLRGRLYRGKTRLRQRLMRRGFSLPAVLLTLSFAREAGAVPLALAAFTLRLASATQDTIAAEVRLLATGVIREMATTFKQRVLFALGALSIAVVGFSICAQAADLDRPESAPLGQAAPNSARVPEMVDRERGGTPPGKQPGDPQPLAKERFKYEGSHGALTADGKTLATWGREFIVLWSTATGKEIGKIKHQGGSFYVRASAFSPDGKFLAAAMLDRDAEIVIWEVATQKQQIALTQRIEEFMSVAWSPDGKILAAGDDSGTLRLYDVQASKLMATLDMKNSGDITALAFAPGGKMLAAAGSGGDPSKVIIWDLASRTVAAELTETTVGVSSLGYTADGKTLISSLRDRVSFWDMEARKLRSTIVSQQKNVNCAAITPDGKLLATGSSDKTVVLWDVATGKPLATLQGHAGSLASLSFSADGRLLLAVRTALNGVRLWELTP
jgi:RNA polymerase sigma factor (sigma-70 family)